MGFSASTYTRSRCVGCLNAAFVLVSCVVLITSSNSATVKHDFLKFSRFSKGNRGGNHCRDLKNFHDYNSKCRYLKSINPCVDQGYYDYLSLIYCNFGSFPLLGQSILFLWLLVLFYVLGDTASEYFCSSLENLSKLLNLSPTIAGVTLLSLGNGAPDVFASLASFTGSGTSELGLNTVVGGALVVTCVVVGLISILLNKKRIRIEKQAFMRDVCFLVLVIGSLFVILIRGKINFWGALAFCLIYVVYVVVVYLTWKSGGGEAFDTINEIGDLTLPIIEKQEGNPSVKQSPTMGEGNEGEDNKDGRLFPFRKLEISCRTVIWVLKLPLSLPRRWTIPVISDTRWSRPTFLLSVTLSPILLSTLCYTQNENRDLKKTLIVYGIGIITGLVLGSIALFSTNASTPPKKFLCIWLAQGFITSMTWTYITAQELVALLISLGYMFGVSPSVLGLTILAWGNSIGDLITNLTMALHGGIEGAQVAVSGCYASPIFNKLVGLGISMVGLSWSHYPYNVPIQASHYLLGSLGLLLCGLLWALVVLTNKQMRLDTVLGIGLLVIYLISMSLSLVEAIGSL